MDIKPTIEQLQELQAKIVPLSQDRNQPMASLVTQSEYDYYTALENALPELLQELVELKHDYRKCPNCEQCITDLREENKKLVFDRDRWKAKYKELDAGVADQIGRTLDIADELDTVIQDRDRWKARAERYEWEDNQGPNDDRPLPEDEDIDATHPCNNTGSSYYAADAEAMRLVGAKRSKRGLVDLVRWLLIDRDKWKDRAETLERAITLTDACDYCIHLETQRINHGYCPHLSGDEGCLAYLFDEARFKEGAE